MKKQTKKRVRCRPAWAFAAAVSLSLPVAESATLQFSDATQAAGLSFTHRPSSSHPGRPMAAGGAVGDFNGDGYPDLFVLSGGNTPDALFINNQDGSFTDQAEAWGITDLHMGVAATVGDYDGDGRHDIYVTSMGTTAPQAQAGRHRLYLNRDGHFVEIATKALVNQSTTWPDGYGATFGDYDLDGDLDLFVSSWHETQQRGSRLFRQEADGRFTDVTDAANVFQIPAQAFGAVFADVNDDQWPDLLVAGDFGTSHLYLNRGDGSFRNIDPGTGLTVDEAQDWSVGRAHNGMGTVVGDFNRDGRPDWFITAIWPTFENAHPHWGNGLYVNQGSGVFLESSAAAGINDGGWGWGAAAVDFDNDGWVDIAMTNGWVAADPVTGHQFENEPSYLFLNGGNGVFKDVASAVGFDHTLQGRGLVHLDYDRDGDMDIAVFAFADELKFYRNDLIQPGVKTRRAHWLQVQLDTTGHCRLAPGAVGAVVRVTARGVTHYHQVTTGGTFLGQSEQVAHFGLGGARKVRRVEVRWADGTRTVRRGVPVDQRLALSAPACDGSTTR